MKKEIQFSWDWKEQADIPKILKAVKKIFDETGKFPNCYNVDTKMDSYAVLITINKYNTAEEIRKRQRYLWIEQECSKEEFEQYKKENENS
jgi:hypothetical protein